MHESTHGLPVIVRPSYFITRRLGFIICIVYLDRSHAGLDLLYWLFQLFRWYRDRFCWWFVYVLQARVFAGMTNRGTESVGGWTSMNASVEGRIGNEALRRRRKLHLVIRRSFFCCRLAIINTEFRNERHLYNRCCSVKETLSTK